MNFSNATPEEINEKIQAIYRRIQNVQPGKCVSIAELVLFSSLKEHTEAILILHNLGYTIAAYGMMRTVYESILWYEARFNFNSKMKNQAEKFDSFFTSTYDKKSKKYRFTKLSDFKYENGDSMTFSSLHRKVKERITIHTPYPDYTKKINDGLDELYDHLCGKTHLSIYHSDFNLIPGTNNEIIVDISIPKPGTGIKLKNIDVQRNILFILVQMFYQYMEEMDRVK
jgi:hypothetical protein